MAHTPPITAHVHAIVTTSPQIAKEATPIWHELAPIFDVPEFGAEPLPLPTFAAAEPAP